MHPAPSIIVFTVLSGLGLGLLAFLGLGVVTPTGVAAFVWFGLGYGLTIAGLGFSAFHLGHPERALKAFSQWRTSWLSREAVLAAATLLFLAPHAAGLVFFAHPLPGFGIIGGVLALQTVLATAMIYAQLRSVPRWNRWTTPAVFLLAALTGGALLIGMAFVSQILLAWLALALVLHWLIGDRAFAASGSDLGTATGLGARGAVRQLEPPHSGQNYLLSEMVYVVARKHALKLRVIALALACILPSLSLWIAPFSVVSAVLAIGMHVAGMLVGRWLFFAEAEHVVGLYYGRRPAAS
ncbi:MAG: dimethyl sulfoxide reductase anchor subunit [Rhodobacteraceae bacterium]|jgi:DMSO reductase anchor subunit|nr:dimethyl sulfoxide reductase anchor subunit [Paracoccaceae bacterium]